MRFSHMDLEPRQHRLDLVCSEITLQRWACSLNLPISESQPDFFYVSRSHELKLKQYIWGMLTLCRQQSSCFHLDILKTRSSTEDKSPVFIQDVDKKNHHQNLKTIMTKTNLWNQSPTYKHIIRSGWDCCCCQVKMLVSSRLLSRSLQLIPDSIAKSRPKATAIQTSPPIELMVFINPPMRAFTDAVTLSHHFIFVEMDRAKTHTRAKKRQKGEKMARLRLRERWENEAPEREGGKEGEGREVAEVLIYL